MNSSHIARSWMLAAQHGPCRQWTSQLIAWIVPKIVSGSFRLILPSELSQNSSQPKNFLSFKSWKTSRLSRITLLTCKLGLMDEKETKIIIPHRYLAPLAFYTRNIETGAVAAVKISQAFGIAVWVYFSIANGYKDDYAAGQKLWNLAP